MGAGISSEKDNLGRDSGNMPSDTNWGANEP